jgi:hypothetical protein
MQVGAGDTNHGDAHFLAQKGRVQARSKRGGAGERSGDGTTAMHVVTCEQLAMRCDSPSSRQDAQAGLSVVRTSTEASSQAQTKRHHDKRLGGKPRGAALATATAARATPRQPLSART